MIEIDYKVLGDHALVTRFPNGEFEVQDINYNGEPDDEEAAVGGILWDLHDPIKDIHKKFRVGRNIDDTPYFSALSKVYPTLIDEISIRPTDSKRLQCD